MIESPGIILPEPMVVIDSLPIPANLSKEEKEINRLLNPEAEAAAAALLLKNELTF